MKKYYGSNPFGNPLNKKTNLDRITKKVSGIDLRVPSETSEHITFFNHRPSQDWSDERLSLYLISKRSGKMRLL